MGAPVSCWGVIVTVTAAQKQEGLMHKMSGWLSPEFFAKRKVYFLSFHDEDLPVHLSAPGRKMAIMQTPLRGQLPETMSEWKVVLGHGGFSLLSSESLL